MRSERALWLWATVLLSGAACSGEPRSATKAAAPPPGALALVNGAAIDSYDLRQATRAAQRPGAHRTLTQPEGRKAVLQTLIRRELIYQHALKLGLDQDPDYQRELRRKQAELAAFKRRALGDRFFQTQIEAKATVSEQQARQYFQRHRQQLQTELHLHQILAKGSAKPLKAYQRELAAGTPFATLALKHLGGKVPPGPRRPWDLGFLRWSQLPEPWREVVPKLEPGQVSDVISGPSGRFWLLKLVARRENPELTFAQARAEVDKQLKRQATEALRQRTVEELWRQARVVYFNDAVAQHKPSTPPAPAASE